MKRLLLLTAASLICVASFAQDGTAEMFAQSISVEDLEDHLSILASDALEGRETGERGQKMAAAYIQHHFKTNELQPIVHTPAGHTYVQEFSLAKMTPSNTWIKIGNTQYENLGDFIYSGKYTFTEPEISKLVFVGQGREADYKAVKVEGKSVLIYSGGNYKIRDELKQTALEMGAKNVFIMYSGEEEGFKRELWFSKRYTANGKLMLMPLEDEVDPGYFFISNAMGLEILQTDVSKVDKAIDRAIKGKFASMLELKSREITFYASQATEEISSENVVGMVEGTDKKDEYIILTAHYDHIGVHNGEINNGADDDGSGTVAIMEIAQAFAIAASEGYRPKRSLVFMTVSGEEKGLLGSSYYVKHPAVPLHQTITNLNVDMIGRTDPKHTSEQDYVYLIGSDRLSTELHEVSEEVNSSCCGLELDYTYNAPDDPNRFYYRSDHYNFAKENVPVIFYFNGTHADYHRPSDTIEKIDFELLKKRTDLIFFTAWELANRDGRIVVDVIPEETSVEDAN